VKSIKLIAKRLHCAIRVGKNYWQHQCEADCQRYHWRLV